VNMNPDGVEKEAVPDAGPGPSTVIERRDLFQEVRRCVSVEECRLADLQGQGHDWSAIAELVGGTADARRVQLDPGPGCATPPCVPLVLP
jgi:hypothetical protein